MEKKITINDGKCLNLPFFILLAGLTCLPGCDGPINTKTTKYLDAEITGSNVTATQIFDVHEFTGVLVERTFNVSISEGPGPRITITADDNITPLLTPNIIDGMLKIEFAKGFRTKQDIKILIEAPDIEKIHHQGRGTVLLDNLKLKFLEVSSSGSGKITGLGMVDNLWIESSGKGEILLHDLPSKKCDITMTGQGEVVVTATEELTAVNRGKGNIFFYGKPAVKSVKNNGSGQIKEK